MVEGRWLERYSMASAWRVPLLLWFAFGGEVLAGSRTVAVEVTFVDVAQHSASQTVNVSYGTQLGQSSAPQFSAGLELAASAPKPLSILVEEGGDALGPAGTFACLLNDPARSACGGRPASSSGLPIAPQPTAGSDGTDVLPVRRPADDLIVTISYH
jgi:hypothetical protein